MQLIKLFGAALLLASTAIGAPGNENSGHLLKNRWWWEGKDNSDEGSHRDRHHASWKNEDDYEDDEEKQSSNEKSASWTNSLTSSIFCTTTARSTIHTTTTVSITRTTTITQYRTHHSHATKYNATSSIFTALSNITIPLSTGYSTGIPSSSALISLLYTNTSRTSIPLATAYSTGLPGSSRLTSLLYTNSTSIAVTPFTTHKSTHTHKHHSHHKATTITISSSSVIFIAASTSIPTADVSTSKPNTALPVTTTVSGTAAPTGTPIAHALLCGVHGFPIGDFFLGQLVESKPDVDITLQSCYEFCAGIYGIDMGCLSIEFYPEPGTDAPRCNLYSEGVAESLDMIIPEVPNVWYDLGCGVPTS